MGAFFGGKRTDSVTVFITGHREIAAMAETILRESGITHAVREAPSQFGPPVYEIGVPAGDFAAARKALQRLAELDATLCGG